PRSAHTLAVAVALWFGAAIGTAVDAQPAPAAAPSTTPPAAPAEHASGLRVHILSTHNTYLPMGFDVFSVATKGLVASSAGVVESNDEVAPVLELSPGLYKIVRAGEPFETRMDFAVVSVMAGIS